MIIKQTWDEVSVYKRRLTFIITHSFLYHVSNSQYTEYINFRFSVTYIIIHWYFIQWFLYQPTIVQQNVTNYEIPAGTHVLRTASHKFHTSVTNLWYKIVAYEYIIDDEQFKKFFSIRFFLKKPFFELYFFLKNFFELFFFIFMDQKK